DCFKLSFWDVNGEEKFKGSWIGDLLLINDHYTCKFLVMRKEDIENYNVLNYLQDLIDENLEYILLLLRKEIFKKNGNYSIAVLCYPKGKFNNYLEKELNIYGQDIINLRLILSKLLLKHNIIGIWKKKALKYGVEKKYNNRKDKENPILNLQVEF